MSMAYVPACPPMACTLPPRGGPGPSLPVSGGPRATLAQPQQHFQQQQQQQQQQSNHHSRHHHNHHHNNGHRGAQGGASQGAQQLPPHHRASALVQPVVQPVAQAKPTMLQNQHRQDRGSWRSEEKRWGQSSSGADAGGDATVHKDEQRPPLRRRRNQQEANEKPNEKPVSKTNKKPQQQPQQQQQQQQQQQPQQNASHGQKGKQYNQHNNQHSQHHHHHNPQGHHAGSHNNGRQNHHHHHHHFVNSASAGGGQPGIADVVSAVESLYKDQLKPYGRILRKRLGELYEASGRPEPLLDVKELKAFCRSCPRFSVEDEGSDWFALIVGKADDFVDVYNPTDVYPPSLWEGAKAHFNEPANECEDLPGGRYACAQVLLKQNLPFLRGCSLGQVCHIVQLAISHKKIFGYSNGMLVPYSRSQSMIKDQRAKMQQVSSEGTWEHPVATWDSLLRCIEILVQEVRAGGVPMPLSSIKRCFQTRFQLELSETALGYAKVSELLQDQKVSAICRVELRAHGYVLLPPEQPEPEQKSSLRRRAGLIQPLSLDLDEILQPTSNNNHVNNNNTNNNNSHHNNNSYNNSSSSHIVGGGPPGCHTAAPSAAAAAAAAGQASRQESFRLDVTSEQDYSGQSSSAAAAPSTPQNADTPARTPLQSSPTMLFPATPSPWSPWGASTPGQQLPTLLGRTAKYSTPKSSRNANTTAPGGLMGLHTLEEECHLAERANRIEFPNDAQAAPASSATASSGGSAAGSAAADAYEPMFLPPPTPTMLGRSTSSVSDACPQVQDETGSNGSGRARSGTL